MSLPSSRSRGRQRTTSTRPRSPPVYVAQAALAACEYVGSLPRAAQRVSDTDAIPSRATAWDMLMELRSATSRNAFQRACVFVVAHDVSRRGSRVHLLADIRLATMDGQSGAECP